MSRLFVVGLLLHTCPALGLVQLRSSSERAGRASMETMGRMGVYAEASADLLFRRTHAAADSLFRRVGLDRTYGMRPAEFSEVMESSWPASSNARCQDAQPGSMCHHATTWLHDKGVANHPEWYPSLSEESTMSEVQFVLYALGKAFCPMPCKARFAKPLEESPDDRVLEVDDSGRQVESEAYELSEPEQCGDTVEGDWCYLSIMWLQHVGLEKHPDWYPTLLGESSMEKFQTVLHDEHKVGCPLPCSNSSAVEQDMTTPRPDARAVVSPSAKRVDTVFKQCRNARKGSSCYDAITQVMDVGLWNNPEEYPELTPDVTRQEVQEHLFLRGEFECERPCPSEKIEKVGRHGKVKKSADDMTMEELSRYLSHEWDGYVDSDEYTSAVDQAHVLSAEERAFEDYTNAVAQDGRQGEPVEEDANTTVERVWQPPVAAEGALKPERDQESLENQSLSDRDAAADECRDTSDGELCYSAVTWARKVGILERPKWYVGLSQNSTFKDFQAYLHKERGSLCQMPCPDAAEALPLVWSDGAWALGARPDPAAAEGDAPAEQNATGPAEEKATAASPVGSAFPEPASQAPDWQNSTLEEQKIIDEQKVTEEDILAENERLRAAVEALTTTAPQPEPKRADKRSKRSKRSKSKRSSSTAEAAAAEAGAGFSEEALPAVDGDARDVNSTAQEATPEPQANSTVPVSEDIFSPLDAGGPEAAPEPEANSTVQEPASQPEAATQEEREAEEERLAKEEFERQAEVASKEELEAQPDVASKDAAAEKQQVEAEVVISEEPLPMIEGDGAATVEAVADSSSMETSSNSTAALEGAEEKPLTAEVTEGELEQENERLRAEIEALTTTKPQLESSHLKLAGRHWRRSRRSKSKRSKSTAEEPPQSEEAATFEVEALKFSEEKSSMSRRSSSTEEGSATAEEAEAGFSEEPLPFVDGDERDDNSTVQEPSPQPEANSTVQESASQPEAATQEEREAEEERLAKEEFERQADAEHKVEPDPERA